MAGRQFKNKVVVITGGASGIGLATALEFARAGEKIVMVDMDDAMLEIRQLEFEDQGFPILMIPCDVTDENAFSAAIQNCLERFKALDVLFNNAGMPLANMPSTVFLPPFGASFGIRGFM